MIILLQLLPFFVATTDQLNGHGTFTSSSGSYWNLNLDAEITMNILQSSTDTSKNTLRIIKSSTQTIDLTKGAIYTFAESQPKHISFEFSSSAFDLEDCNLRLMLGNYTQTILSFRLGNNGLIRMNQNQVQEFYNKSSETNIGLEGMTSATETNPDNINFIKGDFLLDWQWYKIRTFLNGEFYSKDKFYYEDKINRVDSIILYNLKGDTTSFIRNIKVCDEICDDFKKSLVLGIGFITLILLSIIILI